MPPKRSHEPTGYTDSDDTNSSDEEQERRLEDKRRELRLWKEELASLQELHRRLAAIKAQEQLKMEQARQDRAKELAMREKLWGDPKNPKKGPDGAGSSGTAT